MGHQYQACRAARGGLRLAPPWHPRPCPRIGRQRQHTAGRPTPVPAGSPWAPPPTLPPPVAHLLRRALCVLLPSRPPPQALALGQHIRSLGPTFRADAVVISPLTRALETAAGAFGVGPWQRSDPQPPFMVEQVGLGAGPLQAVGGPAREGRLPPPLAGAVGGAWQRAAGVRAHGVLRLLCTTLLRIRHQLTSGHGSMATWQARSVQHLTNEASWCVCP